MNRYPTIRWIATRAVVLTLTSLLAPLPAAAAPKYQCKPALSGYVTDPYQGYARRKATIDWANKVTAIYGKSATFNRKIISDSCTPVRGGKWACTYVAQPCVSALKPSPSQSLLRLPSRVKVRPMRPLPRQPFGAGLRGRR